MTSILSRRPPQGSPSVALEKGSYRMRAPISKPSYSTSSLISSSELSTLTTGSCSKRDSRVMSGTVILHEKKLVLLVMFLALATITCFSVAYYLFTTSRWATPSTVNHHYQAADSSLLQVATNDNSFSTLGSLDSNSHLQPVEGVDDIREERFLSYLPHSGFHNQRIALENALVLSRLLNRTLLVPPIRLGRKAITYDNFTLLQTNIDKDFLPSRCNKLIKRYRREQLSPVIQSCIAEDKIRDHTYLPWDWLTDFAKVRSEQHIIERWNLSSDWITSHLKVKPNQILTLFDKTLYHYQFVDGVIAPRSHLTRGPIYLETVNVSSLHTNSARLIQVGSLFGSSRLKLYREDMISVRRDIRRNMVFTHPVLVNIADTIHDDLGGEHGSGYLGAHVRLNDDTFRRSAEYNTRLIWWKLVHGVLNLTTEETSNLEATYAKYEIPSSPPNLESISVSNSRLFPLFSPGNSSALAVKPVKQCQGKLHTKPRLLPLNVPLFVSTDAKDPTKNRHLSLIQRTFPCTFFLQNFQEHLESLNGLRSPIDGSGVSQLLVPFLDAIVVAKARRVVGTGHSTFSWFVQDVLWRRYHGLDITERGGGR